LFPVLQENETRTADLVNVYFHTILT